MDIFKIEQLRKTLSERMQGIPDSATFQRDMLDDNKRFNLFETVRKSNIFQGFPADYRAFKASLGITEEDITQEQRLFDLNTVVEIGNEQKRAKAEEAASRPNVQGQFSEQIRAAAQRDAAQPLAGAPMPEKTNVQEFGKELQRQGVKPTEQSLVRRVGPQVAFERMKTMGEWTDEDVIKNTLPPDVDYNTATTLVPYIRRIFQDEESLNRRFNDPNFDQYEQAEQIGNMIGKEVENVQSRLSPGARSVLSGGKQDQFEQALQIYSEAGRLGNTMVGRDKSLELYDYFKNNFDDDVIEAVYYIEQRNRLVRDFEAVFKAFPDVRARTERIKARIDTNRAELGNVNQYDRYMNAPSTSPAGLAYGFGPAVDGALDFAGNIAVTLKELTQRGLRNAGVDLNEYTAVDKVFDLVGDYYNENLRSYRPTSVFDDNGNFTADNLDAAISSQVINLVGISKLGQGMAWASSKMLGRSAAAAAGGARVGQFLTSYMLTYGDYIKQATDMGLSYDQAGELAARASGALAFVETVAVGEKLLGAVKPSSFKDAVEAAMRGDIRFRDVGKFMLKETPMEVFEEELALVAESAIHTVFNGKYGTDFDTEITGEDIAETAILTTAATNVVFGLSATGAITNQRLADLEYLSQNLDKFEDYLEEGLATGKITEQQANDAWAKVAEAASAREKANQLTGGKRATDPRIQQAQDLLDDDDLGGFDNFFGETMDGYNYSAQEGLLNIISSFPGAASGEGEGSAVRLIVDNFIEERRSLIKEDRDLAERFKNKEISQSEYRKATNDLINRAKAVAKKFNNEISALADSSMDAALQASGITDPVERDQSVRDFKRNAQMVSDMAIAEIDLAYTANRSNYRQFAKKMVRPALSRIQDVPKDEDRKVRLNGEEVTITKLRTNDDGTISARGTKIDADGKRVNTDWFLMEDAEVSDTSIFDEEGGAAEGAEPAEAVQPNEALTAMRERGLLSEDQTSLTVEGQEVSITDFRENENGEPEFKGTVTDAKGNVTETGWLDYTDAMAGEMGVTALPSRPRAQKKSVDKLQQELDDLVATRDSEDFKYTTDPQAKIDKLQSELDDLLKQRASTDLRFKKKKKGKYGSVRKRRSDAKVAADARALDKQIQKKRRELSEARKVVEAKGEQRLKTEEELIKTTRDINAAIKAKRAEIDNVSRGVDTTGGRKKAVDTPAPAPTVAIPAREEDLTAEKEVAMEAFAEARKKLSEAPASKKQEAELELFDAIKAIEGAGFKLTPAESKRVEAAKTRLKQKGYRTVKANKNNATVFEVIDDPKMDKDSEKVEQVTPAVTKNGKVVRRGKIRVTRGPISGEKIAEQDVADKVAIAEVAGANVDTILDGIADDLSKNPNLTEEDLREERGLDQAVQDALRASALAKDAIDPNKYPEKAKQNKARISKYRAMGYSYKGNVEARDADIVEQLDDPDLKEGEQVVIELVEPQINKDGQVASKAKVIVANGTGADGATAADYSPKTPQELRDAMEAEATRRAEEEAQALADLEAATAATGEETGEDAGEAEITRIKSPGEIAAEDVLKAINKLNSEDIINAIDALFVIDKVRGKVPSIALNNTQTRKIRAARERARIMGYSSESKTNQIAQEGDNVSTRTITNGSQLTEAQVRLLEAMPIGDPDGDVVIITETIKPTIKRDGLIERDAKYRGIRIPAKDVQRVINEARNAHRLANPRDKASIAFTLQQVFDLPVDQAEAAAEVIDSIVATMAARKSKQTGKTVTKEAIYDTIKWFKGLPEGFDGTKVPDSVRAAFIYKSEVEQIIAALTNPDVSSPLHEMAHVFERSLTTEEQKAVIEYAKKLGVQTEDKWTWKTSEVFAEGFERYLRDGMAPSTKLAKIFDKFRTWIDTIASKIAGRDLSPRMREIYDTMLTEGDAFFEKAAKVVPETAKPTAGMVPKPALAAEPGDYVVFNGKNWFVASVTPDGLYKLVSENLRERATTNSIDAVLDLNLPSPETGDTIMIDGNEGVITVEKDKVIIKTADGELVYPNTLSVQKLISAGRRMQQMKEAADTAKAEAEAEALIPVDPEEKKRVEAVNEIKSKRLTRVEQKNGTNMGAGKVMGKYASTEKTNRYYDPEYTTEPYEVDVEITNPYVVDDPNEFFGEWTRIINENFDSFDPLDFDFSNLPEKGKPISSENLSAAGLKKASKIVADDLAKRGYDSVYFRESESQEGEIVVFDHNKLSRKNDKKIGSASYKNNRRNHKEGARVKNFRAGNMTFNARYKLIPASEAMASHNEQTFAKTEGFPTDAQGNTANSRNYEKESTDQASVIANAQAFSQQAATQTPLITKDGIIIDGNGRTMSRKRAAALGTDKEYKQYLRDNAHLYGFKPEDVDAFDDVMLVMEMEDTPSVYDTELFANFNFSDKKEMSDTATGVAISKRMNDNDLIAFADLFSDVERMSDVTTDVEKVKQIKRILIDKGIITKEEIARFFRPDGMLTPSGTQMVISVGLGRIFDENAIYSLMSDGMGKTRQVVLANMPLLLSNSKSKGDSLIQNVNKAVVMLADMKKSGQTPDSMIGQLNIFDTLDMNPVDWAMVTLLRGDKASNESFKQFLNNYNRVVQGNELFEKASQQEFIDKYLTDNISNYEAVRERLKGYESIAAERLRESDEDTRRRDILYQAVGTQAALEAPIRKALATALAFEARDRVASRQGKGDKDLKGKIRAATGWERGADGEWRYEIEPLRFNGNAWDALPNLKGMKGGSSSFLLTAMSNNDPSIKNLNEIIDPSHPIFKYYPQLANIKIFKGSLGAGVMGSYYDIPNSPVIGIDNKNPEPLSTIIHEVAHAVQEIEGFTPGANSSVGRIQKIIDAMPRATFEEFRRSIERDLGRFAKVYKQIAKDLVALVRDTATLQEIATLEQKINSYPADIAVPSFAATKEGKALKKAKDEDIAKRDAILAAKMPLIDKKSRNHVFKYGDAQKILDGADITSYIDYADYLIEQGRTKSLTAQASLPLGKVGFANSIGSEERWNVYRRSAGEAEARNMQARMNMTAEQRRAATLESTADTPYKDQIIYFKDANGNIRFTEEALIPQDVIDNQVHEVERSILFQQTEPQTPSPQLKEKMYEFADRWIRSTGSIAPSKFMRSVPASVKKLMTEEDITAIFEGTAAYAGVVEKRRLRAEGTAEARFGTETRKSATRMTARESTLDPSVKDRIRKERLRYFEEPMHHSEAQVDAWIQEMGLDAATNDYLLDEAGSSLEGHLQVFLGIRLIRKLNEAGDFQRAADVAMKLAEVGTTLGRGVNAFKALATLTPDGLVAYMGKMMAKSESFLREKYRRRIDRSMEKYRQSKAKAAEATTKSFFGNKEWVREAKNRLLEEIKNTSPSVLFQGTGIDPKVRPKIITFGMFLVMEGNNDFNKWSKKMQTQFKLTPLQTQEIWNEKYNAKDTIAGLASFNSFEADVRNNIEDLVALTAIFDNSSVYEASTLAKQVHNAYRANIAREFKKNANKAEQAFVQIIEAGNPLDATIIQKEYLKNGGFVGLDPELERQLKETARILESAPTYAMKESAIQNLMRLAFKKMGTESIGQYLNAAMYFNMLGSPPTHLTNTIANIMQAAGDMFGDTVVAPLFNLPGIRLLTGANKYMLYTPHRYFDNVKQAAAALKLGLKLGISNAKDIIRTGRLTQIQGQKYELPNLPERFSWGADVLGNLRVFSDQALKGDIPGAMQGLFRALTGAYYVAAKYNARVMDAEDAVVRVPVMVTYFTAAAEHIAAREVFQEGPKYQEKLAELQKNKIVVGDPRSKKNKKIIQDHITDDLRGWSSGKLTTRWKEKLKEVEDDLKASGLPYTKQDIINGAMERFPVDFRVKDIAERRANRTVFRNKPEGTFGAIAEILNRGLRTFPPLAHVVPFTNILANVFNTWLDYIPPIAAARALGITGSTITNKMFNTSLPTTNIAGAGGFNRDIDEQIIRRNDLIFRGTLGMVAATVALIALGGEDEEGYPVLTGVGPKDFKKKEEEQSRGVMFGAVKIPGVGYVSYQTWPIGAVLAFIGNYYDIQRYGSQKEKDMALAATIAGFPAFVLEHNFLASLGEFFKTVSQSERYTTSEKIGSTISRALSKFIPFNAMLNNTEAALGLDKPELIGGWSLFRAIPFARQIASDKPVLDHFGRPVDKRIREGILHNVSYHMVGTKRFYTPKIELDEVERIFLKKGYFTPRPSHTLKIGGVSLGEDPILEYDYILVSQRLFKKMADDIAPQYVDLPDDEFKKEMDRAHKEAKQVTKDLFLEGMTVDEMIEFLELPRYE
jgi:hypothetical protein